MKSDSSVCKTWMPWVPWPIVYCVGLGFVQNIGVLQPLLQLLLPSVCTRCTRSAFLTFQAVRTRLSEAENQLNIEISLRIHNMYCKGYSNIQLICITYYIRNPDITDAIQSPTVQSMFFRAENPLIKTKSSIQRPMWMSVHLLTSYE